MIKDENTRDYRAWRTRRRFRPMRFVMPDGSVQYVLVTVKRPKPSRAKRRSPCR